MLKLQHIPYGKGCKFFGLPVIVKAGGEYKDWQSNDACIQLLIKYD